MVKIEAELDQIRKRILEEVNDPVARMEAFNALRRITVLLFGEDP